MRISLSNRTVRSAGIAALAGGGLLLLAGIGGCAGDADTPEQTEVARNVRVLELQRESLTEYFEVSGPVNPVVGTDLSIEESGPVVALPVEKGLPVEAGDLLLEIDRTILRADMESSAARLAVEEFNIDKTRQLYAAEKVSRANLLNAEAQYEEARARAAVAERRYRRAGLTAPFAGVLTDRYVELGQLVLPGQAAVRLIDPSVLKLEAYLTSTEVGWVQPGVQAKVRLGVGGETAPGLVTWIGREADLMTGKFRIEITVPNEDLKLHAGVIGRATLPKQTVNGAVVVPRDAVVTMQGSEAVFVVESGRAVLRKIELGADQGPLVVVRSGLDEGDLLVVRGQRELRNHSLVEITERATARDGSMAGDPAAVEVVR